MAAKNGKSFENYVLRALLSSDPEIGYAGEAPLAAKAYEDKSLYEWCGGCFGSVELSKLPKPAQDFLVVHVPYDSPDMRAIRNAGKKPCSTMIAYLRHMELEPGQDYQLLAVWDKKHKANLPPKEYLLVLNEDAYRMVGKAALLKLANFTQGKELVQYGKMEGYLAAYERRNSTVATMIERIANYADLSDADVEQMHTAAMAFNNRLFSQLLDACVGLARQSATKDILRRIGSTQGRNPGLAI
jgi:hypothetical protein